MHETNKLWYERFHVFQREKDGKTKQMAGNQEVEVGAEGKVREVPVVEERKL